MSRLLLLLALCAAPPLMPQADDYPDMPPLAWAYEFGHTWESATEASRCAEKYLEWLKAVRPFCLRFNEETWDDWLDRQDRACDAWRSLAVALCETKDQYYPGSDETYQRRDALRDVSRSLDPIFWARRQMPPPSPPNWP